MRNRLNRIMLPLKDCFFGRYGLIVILVISKVTVIGSLLIVKGLNRPSYFCNWDCFWYLSIANEGYQRVPNTEPPIGAANWAFFPFVPMAVRLIHAIIPSDVFVLAIFLNSAAFLGALSLIEKINTQNKREARKASLLIALSPITIYVNTFYTESIYFFLVCLVVFLLKQNSYVCASIVGGFLSATRVTGIFISTAVSLTLCLAWYRRKVKTTKLIFGICCSFLGLIIFSVYLKVLTNDYLAFLHIQKAWGVGQKTFPDWVMTTLRMQSPTQLTYLFLLVLTFCITIYLVNQKRFLEAVVTVIPVITTIISSAVNFRYFLVSYVPYLLVANFTKKSKKIAISIYFLTFLLTLLGQVAWQLRLGFMI